MEMAFLVDSWAHLKIISLQLQGVILQFTRVSDPAMNIIIVLYTLMSVGPNPSLNSWLPGLDLF